MTAAPRMPVQAGSLSDDAQFRPVHVVVDDVPRVTRFFHRSLTQALPRAGDTVRAVARGGCDPVAMKDRPRAVLGTVDPLGLLDEIRAVQHHLAGLAAGATVHPMPSEMPTSTDS